MTSTPAELRPPDDLPVVSDPTAIDAAERAIVYCYVEWSVPERLSRAQIRRAIDWLRADPGTISFAFFAIREDDAALARWLEARTPDAGASGSGIVLWLEYGRMLFAERSAVVAGADRLVARTREAWGT